MEKMNYYYIDKEIYDVEDKKVYGDMCYTFEDAEYIPITDYKSDEEFIKTIFANITTAYDDDTEDINIWILCKAAEYNGERIPFHKIMECSKEFAESVGMSADSYTK